MFAPTTLPTKSLNSAVLSSSVSDTARHVWPASLVGTRLIGEPRGDFGCSESGRKRAAMPLRKFGKMYLLLTLL